MQVARKPDAHASPLPATTRNRVALIIPALNEAAALHDLLPELASLQLGQIIVADNGSTDETAAVATRHGATVATAPLRGYGAACIAGIAAAAPVCDILAFLDADSSDDPQRLAALCEPVGDGRADLVIGCRVPHLRETGAMTPPQRFGTWLAVTLIRLGWGVVYHDLGPFRAIHRSAFDRLRMTDRAFGWTVEMQVRAAELPLRVVELPVPYRRRRVGKSKISGTLRGIWLAAYYILGTLGRLYFTRRRRLAPQE